MARSRLLSAVLLASLTASAARAAEPAWDPSRPDSHAPIGVMGDHVHAAGEVMLSYRYGRASMRGNRDGTERVGSDDVLREFPVAPTSMDMEMHMVGAMWAPWHRLTLVASVPFVRMDMEHRTRMGTRFTTRSSGIGDVRTGGLVTVFEGEQHRAHLNLGLSVPTGSTSEKDDTPMGFVRLPYPMQLGSGTWDLLPGATWLGQSGGLSYGLQGIGTLRTGRNGKGYRLGHALDATGWLAWRWRPWLSTSARLAWRQWGDVEGDDDALDPRLVPTADPDRRGGARLEALLGVNLYLRSGPLRGHRFALEVGRPLYQDLDGPQLETDWRATLGWQLAFHP